MSSPRLLTLGLSSILLLSACTSESSEPENTPQSGAATITSGEAFGSYPTLSFEGEAPTELESEEIVSGDGDQVGSGDVIEVNYVGQVFGGDEPFDSSFTPAGLEDAYDAVPVAFSIGTGAVIEGWDTALVGADEGDRLLLTIPPALAYGEAEAEAEPTETPEGTPPSLAGETLVFVVDIISILAPSDALGQADAVPEGTPPAGITVSGNLGAPASVSIDPAAPLPTSDSLTVLARGSGEAIEPGDVVAQFAASSWSGSNARSTWTDGTPGTLPVGASGSPLDQLVGLPLGSRVLLVLAPAEGDPDPSSTASAVVLDLIAQA